MSAKHTPGPLIVRQPESFPFDIQIVDSNGDVVFRESRYAYATKQETVKDVMQGHGFPFNQRDAVIEANERQLADARLRAAAPDLLDALNEMLNDIEGLIGESAGVYGLHMNGDLAPWSELEEGGRFERLSSMSKARAAIAKATGEQQ